VNATLNTRSSRRVAAHSFRSLASGAGFQPASSDDHPEMHLPELAGNNWQAGSLPHYRQQAPTSGFGIIASFAMDCTRVLVLLLLCTLVVVAHAQEVQPTNTIHFRSVDIFVDANEKPLAAYQLEFTATGGDAKIVGIEGGEHVAFKPAPFYDPKAIQRERVIIGAFSTAAADKLPTGKTRVATIHLQTTGEQTVRYEVTIKTAATTNGKKITVTTTAEEKQRNENEKTSEEK